MTDENQNNDQPKWFIDENVPGVGDRPAWLHDRFKTAAELAKSYTELEKRLSNVPENYDLSKSKYIDPEYKGFEKLKQVAKEKRVPQEVMDTMLESIDGYMDEYSTNPDEEMKKLGENAQERLQTLNNWAKANLSKDSFEALTTNLNRADTIKALEELRGKMMNNNVVVPNGNTNAGSGHASLDDLKMELSNPANLEKYKTDDKYRKDYQSRLEVAAKNAPGYVDKIGS